MKIEIFSDVVCPWCFIGKRRLDAALESLGAADFELQWRPYQLYPGLPRAGIDRADFVRRRHGPQADPGKMPERLRVEAEAVGITLDYASIKRIPNTLDAHRLLASSRSSGRQHELAEVLFRYYFCEGRDISQSTVLLDAAKTAGMDAATAASMLADEGGVDATIDEIKSAVGDGVAGVPCYRLGERFMLPGAQTSATMAQFIERARAKLG